MTLEVVKLTNVCIVVPIETIFSSSSKEAYLKVISRGFMALLNIFRTPKPRQFEYKPRYYDAEKEEREERIRMAQAREANDMSEEAMKARIQQGFKRNRGLVEGDRAFRRRYNRRSNRLVVAIVIVLTVFAIYFFSQAIINFE